MLGNLTNNANNGNYQNVNGTNWLYDATSGNWKYKSATDADYAKGVQSIDGKCYIFGDDGVMLTGLVQYNGDYYYLIEEGDSKGQVYTGFINIGGIMYEFDQVTGKMKT